MATKERIKRIEKQARAGGRGLILVRKAGRGYADLAGKTLTAQDFAEITAAGGLILIWDDRLNGI